MSLFALAWKSARARAGATILTVIAIALSTALVLAVEKVRAGARAGFEQTVSGADVLVGARSGSVNLLLYAVFRIGEPTTNVSWEAYKAFSERPDVAWTIPLSLGDSHKGFRVLGTSQAYFDHYRYGQKRPLAFAAGDAFQDVHDAVLGAETARRLGYRIGDDFAISHGVQSAAFAQHDDHPFTVAGVLAPTGTPVDRTIHISLEGLEAVHADWKGGAPAPVGRRAAADHGHNHDDQGRDAHVEDDQVEDDHVQDDHGEEREHVDHADHADHSDEADHADEAGHADEADHADHSEHAHEDLTPDAITAFLVGLRSRPAALRYQRDANTYRPEALTAVIPGVALSQLWRVLGPAEQALRVVSLLVMAAGLTGLLTMLLATLNERRREIAVLRAVGARRSTVFGLLAIESMLVATLGALIGAGVLNVVLAVFADAIEASFGAPLGGLGLSAYDVLVVGAVALLGLSVGFVPGWIAYRRSLSDGLTVRI